MKKTKQRVAKCLTWDHVLRKCLSWYEFTFIRFQVLGFWSQWNPWPPLHTHLFLLLVHLKINIFFRTKNNNSHFLFFSLSHHFPLCLLAPEFWGCDWPVCLINYHTLAGQWPLWVSNYLTCQYHKAQKGLARHVLLCLRERATPSAQGLFVSSS